MRLRPEGHVKFVYVTQCVLFLALMFGSTFQILSNNMMFIFWDVHYFEPGAVASIPTMGNLYTSKFIESCIDLTSYFFMYVTARAFFNDEQELRELTKTFDVRNAQCGVPSDKPNLIEQIRKQFADSGGVGDPLEIFNQQVKKILSSQVVSRSFRILPYSMVVASTWWLVFLQKTVGHDLLDAALYWTPWSRRNNYFDHQWFLVYIMTPYYIFIYQPLYFYTQTLIWKAAHIIEIKCRVPWWILWLPVICFMAIWIVTMDWIYSTWVYYSVACVFDVKNQCPAWKPFGEKVYQGFLGGHGWVPFADLFNSFWTGWLNGEHAIRLSLSPTSQAFGFIIFLLSPVVVWCVHEPFWAKQLRRKLWHKLLERLKRNKKSDSIPMIIQTEETPMPGETSFSTLHVPEGQILF